MERLTYYNGEYGCWTYTGPSGDAAKRLAAYEDTELTPDEVNALKAAWDTKQRECLADEHQTIERFLRSLGTRTEGGVRVSDATIRKLRVLAQEKGFLPHE